MESEAKLMDDEMIRLLACDVMGARHYWLWAAQNVNEVPWLTWLRCIGYCRVLDLEPPRWKEE
jgi:hypothetical protein